MTLLGGMKTLMLEEKMNGILEPLMSANQILVYEAIVIFFEYFRPVTMDWVELNPHFSVLLKQENIFRQEEILNNTGIW